MQYFDDIPGFDKNTYNPRAWEKRYILGLKTFPDGQQELIGHIQERRLDDFPLNRGLKASRGEAEGVNKERSISKSVQRSRSMVRQKCKAIGADHLVTLTVRDNINDVDLFARKFKNLIYRLNKAQSSKLHYVATVEKQSRGALHVHMAVNGRQNVRLIRSIWVSEWGGKGSANVDIRSPYKQKGLRHRIAAYISKYISKDVEDHAFNKKRYWSSKSIEVPKTIWTRFDAFDDFDFVTSCMELLFKNHNNIKPLFNWTQSIGLFWGASSPH